MTENGCYRAVAWARREANKRADTTCDYRQTYLQSSHAHRVRLAAKVQLCGEALDVHRGVYDGYLGLQIEMLDQLLECLHDRTFSGARKTRASKKRFRKKQRRHDRDYRWEMWAGG